jgi:hypothetical protein
MSGSILADNRPTQDEIDAALALGAELGGVEAAPESPFSDAGVFARLTAVEAHVGELSQRVAVLELSIDHPGFPRLPGGGRPPNGSQSVGNHTEMAGANAGHPGGLGTATGDVGTVTMPPVPVPALTNSQGPDPVAHIGYMRTTATLSQAGMLSATTNTRSAQDMRGFTGGVIVSVGDENGGILAVSGVHAFGVDGKWIPGKVSDRTDPWQENFGANAAQHGRTLLIKHVHASRNRFWDDVGEALGHAKTIVELAAALAALA